MSSAQNMPTAHTAEAGRLAPGLEQGVVQRFLLASKRGFEPPEEALEYEIDQQRDEDHHEHFGDPAKARRQDFQRCDRAIHPVLQAQASIQTDFVAPDDGGRQAGGDYTGAQSRLQA